MNDAMIEITDLPPLPDRPDDAHKGIFGTVIVVGGSQTMIGAPALCASAALRSGTGLVKVATKRELLHSILTIEPGATGVVIGEQAGDTERAIERADVEVKAVLAVGPGLGTDVESRDIVIGALGANRRTVLDADGLNVLAQMDDPREVLGEDTVITPHPGEFARLAKSLDIEESATNPDTRVEAALKMAKKLGAVVVLKGRHTVVADGQRYYVNRTGNPALATAGSGDVLTGLVAGLIAQGKDLFDASVLGVHLHGLAGDRWAKAHGVSGLTAADLAKELPGVFNRFREQ